NCQASVSHARRKMALSESSLRRGDQKARRGGGKISGLQLLLGGGVESDHAQRGGSLPAIRHGRRNGLVKRPQRRGRWNLLQQLRGILFAGSKLGPGGGRPMAKIGFRETVDRLIVKTAGVRGGSFARAMAAEPVQRVHGIRRDRILEQESRDAV